MFSKLSKKLNSKIDSSLNKVNNKIDSAANKYNDALKKAVNAGDGSMRFVNDALKYATDPYKALRDFGGDTLINHLQNSIGKFDGAEDIFNSVRGMSSMDDISNLLNIPLNQLSQYSYGFSDLLTRLSGSGLDIPSGPWDFGSRRADYTLPTDTMSSYTSTDTPGLDPLVHDIHQCIEELMESFGHVSGRQRSNMFSRNSFFIAPTYMETDTMGAYKSYAFFIRPNLNIVVSTGTEGNRVYHPHPQLYKYKELSALVNSDLELYAELCRDTCSKSNMFQLLSNYCKEIPPIKLNETDRAGVKNKHGESMPVAGVSNNTGTELSATFRDNANGDISKLFFCIDLYKREVMKGGFAKGDVSIKYKMDNRAMSCYIAVIDTNNTIISFARAIGLVMSDVPTHFAKHSSDSMTKEDILPEFTVTFKCFDYSPMDPSYYNTFNCLSGFDPSRLIDMRGSDKRLMFNTTNGYDGSYNGDSDYIPHKTDVFDNTTAGYNKGADKGTAITNVIKKSLNIYPDDELNNGAQLKFREDVVPNHYKILDPDRFEFLGKSPGVYVENKDVVEMKSSLAHRNSSYPSVNRNRKFKLGFSK